MKIGILTQPLRHNYGGLMQAWALQTVLFRMGHDVVTFNLYPYEKLIWKEKPRVYLKRLIRLLLGQINTIFIEKKNRKEYDARMRNLKGFIERNIKTVMFKTPKDIVVKDYDLLIVGSDQVWRPICNMNKNISIETSFFDFAVNSSVRRIAYAASFGVDNWEYSRLQTDHCAALAKKFHAISVREQSGVDLCKQFLGVDAIHVLDPTLLLNREDYESLIEQGESSRQPDGDMLCYILDDTEEKRQIAKLIATKQSMKPFLVQAKVKASDIVPLEERVQPPMEQWLRNFKDASFVFTDSFHGCVFSIIFGKPFIVVENKTRGNARFKSLIDTLSLEKHCITSREDYNPSYSYTIDDKVYDKIKYLQKKSIEFLVKALSSA